MESIGERLIWNFIPFTDIPIPLGGINVLTVINTAVVMALIFGLSWLAIRRRELVPGQAQMSLELFTGIFDGLVTSSLELETREKNRRFFPLIGALFLFLILSNFIGFVPTHYFEEPTADINCTLGLGILGMVIATWCAIRTKGAYGYFEELLGPMWHQPDAAPGAKIAGKLSALFFLPLNIIGELAKVVSISFRLFGNIIGGSIIIIVVSNLVYNFSILAIGLDLFFIFFVGAVQAFVFTMLTLTYIAVAIK
ncbi:MAG: F0F1 ATP synthase subunit A [Candidatus Hydrogenedentes bacterium]|nr:F0F1 ATP synthase subunit A [Candidatus Hydrogenedentota bacterium]